MRKAMEVLAAASSRAEAAAAERGADTPAAAADSRTGAASAISEVRRVREATRAAKRAEGRSTLAYEGARDSLEQTVTASVTASEAKESINRALLNANGTARRVDKTFREAL
ncbi:hypothetical protein ERJ75_000782400 [Trypanosoma vivax]|nr:hypothetical protein ERJ75_001401000 [Trypanosoma vivax]KAH8613479.1 hypothetical protein ERJ75_000782400 [Trypanosoma vivax]